MKEKRKLWLQIMKPYLTPLILGVAMLTYIFINWNNNDDFSNFIVPIPILGAILAISIFGLITWRKIKKHN